MKQEVRMLWIKCYIIGVGGVGVYPYGVLATLEYTTQYCCK